MNSFPALSRTRSREGDSLRFECLDDDNLIANELFGFVQFLLEPLLLREGLLLLVLDRFRDGRQRAVPKLVKIGLTYVEPGANPGQGIFALQKFQDRLGLLFK